MDAGERTRALEVQVADIRRDHGETVSWRNTVIEKLAEIRMSVEQSNKVHEANVAKLAAHDNRFADHDQHIATLYAYNKTQEAVQKNERRIWMFIYSAVALLVSGAFEVGKLWWKK